MPTTSSSCAKRSQVHSLETISLVSRDAQKMQWQLFICMCVNRAQPGSRQAANGPQRSQASGVRGTGTGYTLDRPAGGGEAGQAKW